MIAAPSLARSSMVSALSGQYVHGNTRPSGATRTVDRPHAGPENADRPRTAASTGSDVATRRAAPSSVRNPVQSSS